MNRSEQINELAAALAKAQGQMHGATKDVENTFFKSKYADLASVWEAIRKPLSDNNLAVVQGTKPVEQGVLVSTMLTHASGQFVEFELVMPLQKHDPQAVGSAITYARRYGLSAIVGVAPEDDDAEGAMDRNAPKHTESKPKTAPKQKPKSDAPLPPTRWADLSADEQAQKSANLKAAVEKAKGDTAKLLDYWERVKHLKPPADKVAEFSNIIGAAGDERVVKKIAEDIPTLAV